MKRITYLEHGGFVVTTDSVIMVFDFSHDPAHALQRILHENPEKPVLFFVTNTPHRKSETSIFEIAQNHKRIYLMSNTVLPQNVPSTLEVAGLSAGDTIENLPGATTVHALESTNGNGITLVVETSNVKIFYGGELGLAHTNRKTTDKDLAKQRHQFEIVIGRIARVNPHFDIAFLSIDNISGGNDYIRNVTEFLNTITVEDLFPMPIKADINFKQQLSQCIPQDTNLHLMIEPGQSINL